MKRLMVLSGIALVIVAGVTFYASSVLGRVQERDRELAAEYAERADDLRALDRLFPYTPAPALDPARFDAYVAVRRAVAEEFDRREQEVERRGAFHARQTRNDLLRLLRKSLEQQRMSLGEYVFLARRWQALLARGEPAELLDAWRLEVRTREHPGGAPLPAPARDAAPAELALLKRNATRLRETLSADLMLPLLERIRDVEDS